MSSDAIVDGRKVFQSHVFTLLCKLCFIALMVCIGSGIDLADLEAGSFSLPIKPMVPEQQFPCQAAPS